MIFTTNLTPHSTEATTWLWPQFSSPSLCTWPQVKKNTNKKKISLIWPTEKTGQMSHFETKCKYLWTLYSLSTGSTSRSAKCTRFLMLCLVTKDSLPSYSATTTIQIMTAFTGTNKQEWGNSDTLGILSTQNGPQMEPRRGSPWQAMQDRVARCTFQTSLWETVVYIVCAAGSPVKQTSLFPLQWHLWSFLFFELFVSPCIPAS